MLFIVLGFLLFLFPIETLLTLQNLFLCNVYLVYFCKYVLYILFYDKIKTTLTVLIYDECYCTSNLSCKNENDDSTVSSMTLLMLMSY